jgi:hypothetical protein
MVDEQLSRAVVAYLLGGRYVRPGESPDAVAGALGAEAAEHLVPRLRELAREAACWRLLACTSPSATGDQR